MPEEDSPRVGDEIIWKNKNTDTIDRGKVRSIVKNTIAIGDHYVSWLLKDDVEIIEYVKRKKIK